MSIISKRVQYEGVLLLAVLNYMLFLSFGISAIINITGIIKISSIIYIVIKLICLYLFQFYFWTLVRHEQYENGKYYYILEWVLIVVVYTITACCIRHIPAHMRVSISIGFIFLFILIRILLNRKFSETEKNINIQMNKDLLVICFLVYFVILITGYEIFIIRAYYNYKLQFLMFISELLMYTGSVSLISKDIVRNSKRKLVLWLLFEFLSLFVMKNMVIITNSLMVKVLFVLLLLLIFSCSIVALEMVNREKKIFE